MTTNFRLVVPLKSVPNGWPRLCQGSFGFNVQGRVILSLGKRGTIGERPSTVVPSVRREAASFLNYS